MPFTNEDLRFKQLVQRRKPATNAVVIFALDVSASMTEAERKLAKTFFFFVLQGIRRKYAQSRNALHRAHHAGMGIFGKRILPGQRHRRHRRIDRVQARAGPDRRPNTIPRNTTAICSMPPTAKTSPKTAPPPSNTSPKLRQLLNYIGYVETVPGSPRTSRNRNENDCAANSNAAARRSAAAC